MKITIIADTHGTYNRLSEEYKKYTEGSELLCLLGNHTISDINGIINDFKNIPIIGVNGNHDALETFANPIINNIDNKIYKYKNITFTGFSGSSKYKDTQIYSYTQEEATIKCNNLKKSNILISHDGPFGYCGNINDNTHCGLQGILDYIEKNQPKLVFFGHHHFNKNFKIGKTRCFCVYGIGVFEINYFKKISNFTNYIL